jgi:thiamine pyrophosphate-dependent acetolactate synthase large subunit-like protein
MSNSTSTCIRRAITAIEAGMASIACEVHPIVPTVPGGYCMPILIAARLAGLEPIVARSEAGAAMIASGIAWESGLPTLVVTITGCGVFGVVPALSIASVNRIPLVLVSGECSTDDAVQSGDGMGGGPSIVTVTAPLVAWAAHIARPAAVPGALLRAVRMAATLRRPVHISIPMNVCNAEACT